MGFSIKEKITLAGKDDIVKRRKKLNLAYNKV